MPDIDKSYQELIITNFGLSPSGYTGSRGDVGATGPAGGYTGSRGDVGYVGSAGPGMSMTTDTFTGDGTTTTFALTTTPESINRTIVNYNGVTVLRSTYTLSQANVTFSSAPAAGSQLEITTINSASGGGAATGTALKISSIGYVGNNTATDVAGGETITLTGTGFVSGASVIINGVAAGVVTVVSDTQLTFTAPALTAGTYIFYVVNTDGATAISVPGISYSGVPSFYTGAGSVGTVYEASSFNSNVSAVGDSTITYTIASGSLPAGATLNANGVITGSSVLTASPTTYTFGVNASDGQNQDVVRSYTITVNPDTVTWSAPTNNATVTLGQGSSVSTTLTAVSAAGSSVAYTANTLPSGLSIVGGAVTGTPTVLGNTTTLLTANATSTTRSATITVTWNVAVTNEPYFMYNSLLLPGTGTNGAQNNTFLDGSTNNFTITRNGNTTQGTFSPYGPNWSNFFNGSSYLESADPGIGSGSFTIEFWVNFSTVAVGYNLFVVGSTANTQLFLSTKGDGTGLRFGLTGVAEYATGTFTWSVGTWYHVALVRNSTTIKFYVNGTNVTVGSPTNATSYSGVFRIAGGGVGGTNLSGYVSNLRTVKSAVYTANFTPPTSPLTSIANTALLTCQSNRFIDNSSSALTITTSGTPTVQRFSPFSPTAAYSTSTIGGSGYFDGSGDYLTAAQNAAFNFGTGAFTVEAWVYLTAYPSGGNSSIFSLGDGATGPSGPYSGWALTFGSTSINFYRYDGTETNNSVATAIPLNTWSHVVAVRNGSSNLSIYLNGTRILNNASSTTSYNNVNSNNLNIGYWNSGASPVVRVLTGYYSDGRIVKGTAVYDPTLTTLTVPTAPLTAVSGTQLLLNYTNAGIIDNTMINNLETVGNAQISSAQTKFGSGSMSFDGTGDYLSMPANPTNRISTAGNFTIEFWAYFNTVAADQRLLAWDNNSSNFVIAMYTSSSGVLSYYLSSTGNTWNIAAVALMGNITSGTWYHVALVRNGSVFTPYVNGVAGTSTTSSATLTSSTLPFMIGAVNGSSPFNGYIDDFRITNGVARYTANFTPPITAFSQK